MKRFVVACLVASLAVGSASPAFAVSKLKKYFADNFAGEKASDEFKGLVKDAGCYVCHVKGEDKKKVRNDYGKALHEMMEKDEFPIKEWEKDQEKFAERLKDIFKKVGAEKSGDEKYKTFQDRMDANLLPGGNVEGKKDE